MYRLCGIERDYGFVHIVEVRFRDDFVRGVHRDDRYADVDGVDVLFGNEFRYRSAVALVDLAEFRLFYKIRLFI